MILKLFHKLINLCRQVGREIVKAFTKLHLGEKLYLGAMVLLLLLFLGSLVL